MDLEQVVVRLSAELPSGSQLTKLGGRLAAGDLDEHGQAMLDLMRRIYNDVNFELKKRLNELGVTSTSG